MERGTAQKPTRVNLKDKTKFRSRRNNKNLINSFELLLKSEKTDGSDGFWSEDTKRIDNRKVYKNKSYQGNRNYRKYKKKAVKNRVKKKSNKPNIISIQSESSN